MKVIVYGTGGHCSVVIDAILSAGLGDIECLVDDDQCKWGLTLYGYLVISPEELKERFKEAFLFIAIGDNKIRMRKARELEKLEAKFLTVIHPTAYISPSASLGEGTFVGANAVVNPCAKIGKHCIINTGAVVEHHCEIADFVHVAPNATLGGKVFVGESTLVGLSATILPKVKVGRDSIIGAGAVVKDDVPDEVTVVGVPAHPLNRRLKDDTPR